VLRVQSLFQASLSKIYVNLMNFCNFLGKLTPAGITFYFIFTCLKGLVSDYEKRAASFLRFQLIHLPLLYQVVANPTKD
jgi:hypothetical protein